MSLDPSLFGSVDCPFYRAFLAKLVANDLCLYIARVPFAADDTICAEYATHGACPRIGSGA